MSLVVSTALHEASTRFCSCHRLDDIEYTKERQTALILKMRGNEGANTAQYFRAVSRQIFKADMAWVLSV